MTGIYKYHTGETYEGEYVRNKMQGKGTYTYRSGAIYTGNFEDGVMSGHGIFKFKNGQENGGGGDASDGATGETKEDGKASSPLDADWTGNVYDGQWKDGLMHGKGKLTFASGRWGD